MSGRLVKALPRVLLGLYVLVLLWLILFKLSYAVGSILADHQTRSVSLIPFVTLGQTGLSETVSNLVIFVPLGLLLAVNFPRTAWWRLGLAVLAFSVVMETLQFVLAIGTTDTTDVVTNTVGGLAGIALYRLANLAVRAGILDRIIVGLGSALFLAFVALRVLVLQVRY